MQKLAILQPQLLDRLSQTRSRFLRQDGIQCVEEVAGTLEFNRLRGPDKRSVPEDIDTAVLRHGDGIAQQITAELATPPKVIEKVEKDIMDDIFHIEVLGAQAISGHDQEFRPKLFRQADLGLRITTKERLEEVGSIRFTLRHSSPIGPDIKPRRG